MNKTTTSTIEYLPVETDEHSLNLDMLRAIVRDTADLPGDRVWVRGRFKGDGGVPPVTAQLVGITLLQSEGGNIPVHEEMEEPTSDAPKYTDAHGEKVVDPYDGKVFCPEHIYEYRVREAEDSISFPRYGRIKAVPLEGRRPSSAALETIRDHFGLHSSSAIRVRRNVDATVMPS